jgi:hypothetical protein
MSAMAKVKAVPEATEVNTRPGERLSDKARLERALKVLRRIVEEGQGPDGEEPKRLKAPA